MNRVCVFVALLGKLHSSFHVLIFWRASGVVGGPQRGLEPGSLLFRPVPFHKNDTAKKTVVCVRTYVGRIFVVLVQAVMSDCIIVFSLWFAVLPMLLWGFLARGGVAACWVGP